MQPQQFGQVTACELKARNVLCVKVSKQFLKKQTRLNKTLTNSAALIMMFLSWSEPGISNEPRFIKTILKEKGTDKKEKRH